MKTKRIALVVLSAFVIFSALPAGVFAENNNGSTTETEFTSQNAVEHNSLPSDLSEIIDKTNNKQEAEQPATDVTESYENKDDETETEPQGEKILDTFHLFFNTVCD